MHRLRTLTAPLVLLGGFILWMPTLSSAAGQTPIWVQRGDYPYLRRLTAGFAFDQSRGVAVLFGGYRDETRFADTWEWDGWDWTLRATTGPQKRETFAMAYDRQRGVTVLYGGYDNSDPAGSAQGRIVYGDTWEWDGQVWTYRTDLGPGPRDGHSMTYDSDRHVCVMFSGYSNLVGYVNDTWEWDGQAWVLKATSGPPARVFDCIAYDARRHVTVLFGGSHGSTYYGDTWEWDGSTWTQREISGPSARNDATMIYDEAHGRCVLFGGGNPSHIFADTWTYDGTAWTLEPGPDPPRRLWHMMTYDSNRQVAVLFGGLTTSGTYGDLWERGIDSDGDAWPDGSDNCPHVANPGQEDFNRNHVGDICDPVTDVDGDGVDDHVDNCMQVANGDQADSDGDGVGDVCDACPGTYAGNSVDAVGCILPFKVDFDNDGDVDQSDFGLMQRCLTGQSSIPATGPCAVCCLDTDVDVDATDMQLFLGCLRGPDMGRNEACLP